jgi:hypothetical protein
MTTIAKAAPRKKAEKPKKPAPLVLNVVRERDGYTFALDVHSKLQLRAQRPDVSLPNRSFVSFDVKQDFASLLGRIIDHILPLLTGLSRPEIDEIGVQFRDSWNDKPLGQWRPVHP